MRPCVLNSTRVAWLPYVTPFTAEWIFKSTRGGKNPHWLAQSLCSLAGEGREGNTWHSSDFKVSKIKRPGSGAVDEELCSACREGSLCAPCCWCAVAWGARGRGFQSSGLRVWHCPPPQDPAGVVGLGPCLQHLERSHKTFRVAVLKLSLSDSA